MSAHAKNVLDAKTCLPTLWYAFDAGCKIALSGDGAGGVALRVDNKGGKVFDAAAAAGGQGWYVCGPVVEGSRGRGGGLRVQAGQTARQYPALMAGLPCPSAA